PERALALAEETPLASLPVDQRVEMALVIAGARRDLGQVDAALLALELPELRSGSSESTVRLQYAYADALAAAGRDTEAREWFVRVRDADPEEITDAAQRLDALTAS
ncbi:MAG: hypothetical protein ACRDRL_18505, partial [Sciscionella sp.]